MQRDQQDLDTLVEMLNDEPLDRRQLLKRSAVFALGIPVSGSLMAACGSDDEDSPANDDDSSSSAPTSANGATSTDESTPEAESTSSADSTPDDKPTSVVESTPGNSVGEAGEGTYGGTINIALIGEPDILDIHQTSSLIPMFVSMHMFETLFTWDDEFQIIPDLVEQYEVSDDGLINTITVRQGVLFHNGEEMTTADVRASIERWAGLVGYGESLMSVTAEVREVDDYTLEFEMTEPFGTFAIVLARQNNGCAIYPKTIVDAAGSDPIKEFIGTGPYRFVEHLVDRHILLERFEDFSYRDEPPNGYGGRKYAYADQLRFVPVPDEAARIAGLQAGDYHYLASVSSDQYETLTGDSRIVAELAAPTQNELVVLNTAAGLMSDISMRQAVQAAVDVEPILQAMFGDENYRIDPSWMPAETVWSSTVGESHYNMADPDLAKSLLEQAGYNGETIRIFTTQEYAKMYNLAIVLQQQLEQIGMTVETQVFDWSTLLDVRGDQSAWEILVAGFTFRVDPSQLPLVRCEYAGWWCTDTKQELVERIFSEVKFDDRYATWEELQGSIYEYVPFVKVGEGKTLLAYSAQLQNLGLFQLTPAFWNVWLDE